MYILLVVSFKFGFVKIYFEFIPRFRPPKVRCCAFLSLSLSSLFLYFSSTISGVTRFLRRCLVHPLTSFFPPPPLSQVYFVNRVPSVAARLLSSYRLFELCCDSIEILLVNSPGLLTKGGGRNSVFFSIPGCRCHFWSVSPRMEFNGMINTKSCIVNLVWVIFS